MNTITETIPTVFNPETAFVISLHSTKKQHDLADQIFTSFRFALPPEDEFLRRGIPESALHD